MQSALAPWLSNTTKAQQHTIQAPANAANRGTTSHRRYMCNGIAKFPVWMSVPDGEDVGVEQQSRGSPHTHCPFRATKRAPATLEQSPPRKAVAEVCTSDDSDDCIDVLNSTEDAELLDLRISVPLAVQPLSEQVSDIEAAHGSTTSSGSTGCSDESLSDDFIDKIEPGLTHVQEKILMRFFPIMCQHKIENGL
jgi:hypothetical protein